MLAPRDATILVTGWIADTAVAPHIPDNGFASPCTRAGAAGVSPLPIETASRWMGLRSDA